MAQAEERATDQLVRRVAENCGTQDPNHHPFSGHLHKGVSCSIHQRRHRRGDWHGGAVPWYAHGVASGMNVVTSGLNVVTSGVNVVTSGVTTSLGNAAEPADETGGLMRRRGSVGHRRQWSLALSEAYIIVLCFGALAFAPFARIHVHRA